MEKVDKKETSYAILMSRVLIAPDTYIYKPVSVIKGFVDDVEDYDVFIDDLGNTYLLSTDAQGLSCDEELSVTEIIDEEDLIEKYGDVSLIEAIDNYYMEMINYVHIGAYDPINDKVLISKIDIIDILSNNINIQSEQTDDELIDEVLNKNNGDNVIFIGIEKFKELLQIKEYNKLHNELKNMFDEVKKTNEYFGIETEKNTSNILDLFEKIYNFLLEINDIEKMRCVIQSILDVYSELFSDEKYSSELCQNYLSKKLTKYFDLLEFENISDIKKGILEIKKEQASNIARIIEKSKEVIVTDEKEVNIIINVKEMKEYFDRKIIGQEEAKRDVISTIIMNSLSDDKRDKNGCLLIGPTGSGKTLVAQTASEYLDRPMQVFDTTQLTVPGYKGGDIEDFLVRLLSQTNGDLKKAENAIVVFDEIDKKGSDDHSDVSGKGVLDTLLSFIQGTTYDVKYNGRTILFDTSKLTVFATGAFTDVAEAKQIKEKPMGFSAKIEDKEEDVTYPELTIQDLAKFGKIPVELLGRFSTITQLKGHTKETLRQIILDCDNSVLLQEKNKLKKLGIDIKWTNGYIDAVVDKAFELKTGARSLKNILEQSIKNVRWEALYNLGFYTTIVLTKDTVNDNEMCQLYDYKGNVYNLKDILNERKEKIKKLEMGN